MKTIKNSKDITTLEVGDVVVFGDLKYSVASGFEYFLTCRGTNNDKIFRVLNINKRDFIENLGIDAKYGFDFPEVKSLEALTAVVVALFKEYEKQNELPKTWEEFCEKYHIKEAEAFINSASDIVTLNDYFVSRKFRLHDGDRNLCTSKQEAEAHLALMQLRQLRKAYVKNWEPDGTKGYWGIYLNHLGTVRIVDTTTHLKVLSFPTYELAAQFAHNFKKLLRIANPLL